MLLYYYTYGTSKNSSKVLFSPGLSDLKDGLINSKWVFITSEIFINQTEVIAEFPQNLMIAAFT